MKSEGLIGVHVRNCHKRVNRRSFFYSGQWPGWDHGSTLLRVFKGKAIFSIGGSEFTAGQNDMVIWNPGGLKELRPHPDTPVSYYAFTFDLYMAFGEAANVSRLGLPMLMRGGQTRGIWPIIKSIRGLQTKKQKHYLEKCSVLALKLFEILQKAHSVHKEAPKTPGLFADRRIRETLTFAAENYKRKLTVTSLAQRAGMHASHYTRLFTKMMGMAPYQYLLERKIDKAKDFLRLYNDDPSAVSLEFGFHDYAHFSRTFKRLAGMSPSEYVKQHKSG